jgi:hypothetical protein
MTKEYIFEAFKALPSAKAKVEYLRGLEKLNLPYDFNYPNLIKVWESKVEVTEA